MLVKIWVLSFTGPFPMFPPQFSPPNVLKLMRPCDLINSVFIVT